MSSATSSATDSKLRQAMNRLLAGEAIRCDGRLTKTNLAAEAQVSRATMNRAAQILADWDQQVADRSPRSSTEEKLRSLLSSEQERNSVLVAENKELNRRISAALGVILELQALLEADNPHTKISVLRRTPGAAD